MIVVSDTTCIPNLIAIGRIELLRNLFGEVIIPDAVDRELRAVHDTLPNFLRHGYVRDRKTLAQLTTDLLDDGEAEAIMLAEELKADYLLMDETIGRRVAKQRNLRVVGLLGVLGRAKDAGLLNAISPLLDALENEAGFWFSSELRQQILREAGEA